MPLKPNNIIVGASGLIGGALYRSFIRNNERVVGTYSTHGDTPELLHFDMRYPEYPRLVRHVGPDDNVYIMAAYSNPSWIFANQIAARRLNLDATIALIDALRNIAPRIIFMSSVEVFDGVAGSYREFDKPNPLNYYGQMKYQVEEYLRSNYPKFTIVRTGWNIGLDMRSRCVIRLTYESLLKPNAVMAADNFFSISDVEDTANALRLLGQRQDLVELHICSDEVIRRDELAKLIVETSINGSRMAYRECRFADIPYSEPRGRVNNLLNTNSKAWLGVKYRSARDIVVQKVNLLDRHF